MENFFDTFLNAYTITSQVVFPMLIFIIILLVIDLGKYSKLSDKISKILTNLSDSIEDSGFKKDTNENELSSGRWHLDSFNNQIKVFTFLNDVNEENGPFEMIPKTHKKMFKISNVFSAKLLKIQDIIKRNGSILTHS